MENNQFENFLREPNISLKGAFYCHLSLLSWALITSWSPSAYFFYNGIFLILFLWGIAAKGNPEPLEMGQIVNFLSGVLDVFVVCIYFPTYGAGSKISAVMGVLNIFLRPFTFAILRTEIRNRRDGVTNNFPNTFGSQYQDIDSAPGTP